MPRCRTRGGDAASPPGERTCRLRKRTPQSVSVLHDVVKYFRANPQALALLVICLVLGLGTFLAVVIALITSGSTTTTGEPSGLILALHALLG